MDRVFVDANVLFSAAYAELSQFRALWALEDTRIVTSSYAVEEARRNLGDPEKLARLDALLKKTDLVPAPADQQVPVELHPKDRPILLAAVGANCTHLLTGDERHFGRLYNYTINVTVIMRPADYMRKKGLRQNPARRTSRLR